MGATVAPAAAGGASWTAAPAAPLAEPPMAAGGVSLDDPVNGAMAEAARRVKTRTPLLWPA